MHHPKSNALNPSPQRLQQWFLSEDICFSVNAYTFTYTHACTYTYLHTYMHTAMMIKGTWLHCTHMHIHIHLHVHIQIQIYIVRQHTFSQTKRPKPYPTPHIPASRLKWSPSKWFCACCCANKIATWTPQIGQHTYLLPPSWPAAGAELACAPPPFNGSPPDPDLCIPLTIVRMSWVESSR